MPNEIPNTTEKTENSKALERAAYVSFYTEWDSSEPDTGGLTFEQAYNNYRTNFKVKQAMAEAIIESGKHPHPARLAADFIPKGVQITPELIDMERSLKTTVLIKTGGKLDTKSEDAQKLQEGVGSYIESHEALRTLQGLVPIHVMGAIASAFMFEAVGDKAKLEELRKYTTKSLLRPYLGDMTYRKPTGQGFDVGKMVEMLPERILDDPGSATYNIVRSYILTESMKFFIDGEEEGFKKLEETVFSIPPGLKRQLFTDIHSEFKEIAGISIPSGFTNVLLDPVTREPQLDSYGNTIPFPNFRQKLTLYEFLKTNRKLLNGDTGATKTACAYLAMEAAGAQKVTIFGPAKARNTWPIEAKKCFGTENDPTVFTIKDVRQLDDPRIETAKYVYVSMGRLGRAWENTETYQKLIDTLTVKRQTDGIILDESDELKNKQAKQTKMFTDLVRKMRDSGINDMVDENGKEKKPMPIVALTATPLATDLSDLDTTMAVLYPQKFSFPDEAGTLDESGAKKTTFKNTVLNNPRIAYSLLFGEQLMLQWSQKDMFRNVQEINQEEIDVKISPTERAIYEWVKENTLPERNAITRISLLSSTLLNPELIKSYFLNTKNEEVKALIPPTVPIPELKLKLEKIFSEYSDWYWEIQDERLLESFSTDWLVKHGHTDFLMQCFFSPDLASGVDTLAQNIPLLKGSWESPETASSKYTFLKSFLQERFKKGPDGKITPSEKVFIVSPFLKKGFTRWIGGSEEIKEEDLKDNTFSLYEFIRMNWLPDMNNADAERMIINLDGDDTDFVKREKHAKLWRESGDDTAIIVATLKSVYESMDFAIRDLGGNKNIDKSTVIFLGWPWGWDEYKQMCGRFIRPGQGKPAEFLVLESEGTIDKGMEDLVYRKYLLTQMTLAGIELTPEDAKFFNDTNAAMDILSREGQTGQVFIRNILSQAQGKGSVEFANSLVGKEAEWIKPFYDEGKDEFRQIGHNAELMKNVLSVSHPELVLSVGAGTCLLARKYKEENSTVRVDNIDILPALMHFGKEAFELNGENFIGNAADLKNITNLSSQKVTILDETYDAIDCSFMLDITALEKENGAEQSERMMVLSEINRALKTGGRAVFSFHRGAFEDNTVQNGNGEAYAEFKEFTATLEQFFGFKVIQELSGKTFATDLKPPKRIGWVISVEKTGLANTANMSPNSLSLLSDIQTRLSRFNEKKKTPQIAIDYPVYSPKKFEIYNPVTEDVSTADSGQIILENPTNLENTVQAPLTQPKVPNRSPLEIFEISAPKRLKNILTRVVDSNPGVNEEEARRLLDIVATTYNLDEQSEEWQPQHFGRLQRQIETVRGRNGAK